MRFPLLAPIWRRCSFSSRDPRPSSCRPSYTFTSRRLQSPHFQCLRWQSGPLYPRSPPAPWMQLETARAFVLPAASCRMLFLSPGLLLRPARGGSTSDPRSPECSRTPALDRFHVSTCVTKRSAIEYPARADVAMMRESRRWLESGQVLHWLLGRRLLRDYP